MDYAVKKSVKSTTLLFSAKTTSRSAGEKLMQNMNYTVKAAEIIGAGYFVTHLAWDNNSYGETN